MPNKHRGLSPERTREFLDIVRQLVDERLELSAADKELLERVLAKYPRRRSGNRSLFLEACNRVQARADMQAKKERERQRRFAHDPLAIWPLREEADRLRGALGHLRKRLEGAQVFIDANEHMHPAGSSKGENSR